MDKKVPRIAYHKMELENKLHTNDEHVIAKTYTLLLRFEIEES